MGEREGECERLSLTLALDSKKGQLKAEAWSLPMARLTSRWSSGRSLLLPTSTIGTESESYRILLGLSVRYVCACAVVCVLRRSRTSPNLDSEDLGAQFGEVLERLTISDAVDQHKALACSEPLILHRLLKQSFGGGGVMS